MSFYGVHEHPQEPLAFDHDSAAKQHWEPLPMHEMTPSPSAYSYYNQGMTPSPPTYAYQNQEALEAGSPTDTMMQGNPPSNQWNYVNHSPANAYYEEPRAAPLPHINSLMKETKDEYEFFAQHSGMASDYSVEKLTSMPLTDYSLHIPTENPQSYADFANASMLGHPTDVLPTVTFAPNPLHASYAMAVNHVHPASAHFPLFDFTLQTLHPIYEPPVMQPSPQPVQAQLAQIPQPTYAASTHNNYTPPPQDPLVQRPMIKKRLPAVQCHVNSVCANCKTRETTLWRRNQDGDIECNACNLYFRKNNRKRPLALRKEGIMKRNRKPRNESPPEQPLGR
ncbi:unnamed protein product [Caenorhabditis auriculariae]|uniref:GATA-type domain-containing protein n=1 Tax=Caenorhabditis auriculariae TaxID=2777116 RepID=A0A8S1GW39_9PELO|nr:unnamed protein product [Caenorhabditis auriculariae]